jgi:thioester reductase-like protein
MNMFVFDTSLHEAAALAIPMDTLLADSLSALRLARAISIEFGTDLHVTALLEAGVSLIDIAARLETGVDCSSGSLAIDFAKEAEEAYYHAMVLTTSDASVSSPPVAEQCRVEEGQRTVVLSGATGYVGIFLLVELLRQVPPTILITCLVRASDLQSAFARLAAALALYSLIDAAVALKWRERIKPLLADLGKPGLGVVSSQLKALGASAVLVLHCGALVNAALPYSKLKDTNVGGTVEMIRLAAVNPRCFFCFVSTAGVLPPSMLPLLEQDAVPPYHLQRSTGYAQSKWVAESVVRKAFCGGLSGCVVRLANAFCSTQTGATNATDFVIRCLRGMAQLRCAPVLSNDVLADVTPVDALARAIVSLCAVPTAVRGPTKHNSCSAGGAGDGGGGDTITDGRSSVKRLGKESKKKKMEATVEGAAGAGAAGAVEAAAGDSNGCEASTKAGEVERSALRAMAMVDGRTLNLSAGPMRMSVLVTWLREFLHECEREGGGGGGGLLRMENWATWRTLLDESTKSVLEQQPRAALIPPAAGAGSGAGAGGGGGGRGRGGGGGVGVPGSNPLHVLSGHFAGVHFPTAVRMSMADAINALAACGEPSLASTALVTEDVAFSCFSWLRSAGILDS